MKKLTLLSLFCLFVSSTCFGSSYVAFECEIRDGQQEGQIITLKQFSDPKYGISLLVGVTAFLPEELNKAGFVQTGTSIIGDSTTMKFKSLDSEDNLGEKNATLELSVDKSLGSISRSKSFKATFKLTTEDSKNSFPVKCEKL